VRMRFAYLFVLMQACSCSPGTGLFAQTSLDIASGPRDVLYEQSQFSRFPQPCVAGPCFAPESTADSTDTPASRALAVRLPPDEAPKAATDPYIESNPPDGQAREGTHFRWGPAFGEALLFTGIMHTFNITTEAGTRDTLNGPG
jgi:hypothetical protein